VVDSTKRLFTAMSTWGSVFLVLKKSVLGAVSFVALTSAGSLSAVMVAAPFVYDSTPEWVNTPGAAESYRFGSWTVETLPVAVGVAFAGIVFVAFNLLNGFASLQARYTAALLSEV